MFTMFKIQRLTFLSEFLLSCPSCSSCKSCSDFQDSEESVGEKVLNPKQDFHDSSRIFTMFTMFKIQRLTFLSEFLLSCKSCKSCKSCSMSYLFLLLSRAVGSARFQTAPTGMPQSIVQECLLRRGFKPRLPASVLDVRHIFFVSPIQCPPKFLIQPKRKSHR